MIEMTQQNLSDTRARNPVDGIVSGGVTTLFALFTIAVCFGLYVLIERHQSEMQEDSLLRTAITATTNMTKFRSFYSQEILSQLDGSNVIVTHDYRNQPNALPLPATMTIEFGKFLESNFTFRRK